MSMRCDRMLSGYLEHLVFGARDRKRAVHMPTTWGACSADEAYRRAGGRRRHNSLRKLAAELRRGDLAVLMREGGLGPGAQSRYARVLGVHRSTISRDLDILIARCMDT